MSSRNETAEDAWRPSFRMEPHNTFRFRAPIDQLVSRITPNEQIFVLSHFGVPRIEADAWRLHFSGLVDRAGAMTLEELRAFPRREVEAFVKCAGFPENHRIATRNVSNAVWAGASLKEVMDAVGLSPKASFLWLSAPDHGTYRDWSANRYVKDLPIARVGVGDVLLAYEVNGAALPAEHGFPVRVLVPGFYGTNSVKWLCHIEAADRRAPGLFTNELYNDPAVEGSHVPGRVPVWGAAPEALIVSPASGAKLPLGTIVVSGWCWGEHPIVAVELSLDGGRSWRSTKPEVRHQTSWQAFAFEVSLASPGEVQCMVRATDGTGASQPLSDARNSVHAIRFTVDGSLTHA